MEDPALIRAVEEAFEEQRLPPAATMTNDHCDECIDTYRGFWNGPQSFMTWQEAARQPGSCVEASLLTADAWRYYLPTLIIWCVRDSERVDALVDNLVHELTPPASDTEWFRPRADGFSAEQREAIARFLRWYQARERLEWESICAAPPDHAGDAIRYWSAAG
jgi:hypothetical protein